MTTRYKIVKGYLTLKAINPDTGEVTKEGGFTEDPENGKLYAVLDTQTKKIVDGSFDSKRAEELTAEYEAGKPAIAALSAMTPKLDTVTLKEDNKTVTYKPSANPGVLHPILTLNREKPPKFDLTEVKYK